jgi:type VI secretion system protein ImpL
MLIWDLKRLKELSALIDKYYDFSENMPTDMRSQFFDMYKTIARKCFYPIISSMLGSAQIFDDMPLGRSNNLLEDAYKRQAINIRGASFALPKIAKIIDEMEDEDNAKDCGFSSMIISQYSTLLEKVDALFDQEKPYSAEHAAFDHWNGDTTPTYLNMGNQEELKQYLTAQFARIRFLAKDLATPIVDLLSMPHFVEKIKNHNLLEKWKGIIASIDDYESKKPGNSIAALESFLADSLSKVSVGSLDEHGEIKTISETSGDYFLSKRSDVAKSLLSRADVVKYDKAANAYTKIQKFFNDNLAHKFPFGESKTDASLKDVENFINLYEQNSSNVRDVLFKNQKIKNVNGKALEFLELVGAKLIPFLKIWIAHSKTADAASALVTFNVQTRPSPELEAFTSSVMDREFKINNAQINDNDNGLFYNGNKVDLIFNWVASADEKPNEQKATGNMLIAGAAATFSYEGKWAMFRMIEENKTNKETESPNGVLLQFNVPIIDSSQGNSELIAKMVLKITPMSKDGDKTAPMAWPIFPESCPGLHGEENIGGEQHHD